MSASPEFVTYVQEQLAPLGPLAGSRLFGGYGFKSGTRQFAMIMGNSLYFCVDDTTRPGYEARGMKAFSYTTKKGSVQVRRYFTVPEEVLEDRERIVDWARAAIASAGS